MKSTLLLFTFFLWGQLSAQTTVFQSDFSTPASYTVVSVNSGDWIVGANGPQGVNSQSMGAMNSTTPTEFALFDSDFLGSPGVQQDAYVQMNDLIDVSSYTFAYVCFESYYKHDAGQLTVEVSNDEITWTTFSVHTNLAQGDSTSNTINQLLDVSAVAGNQATVSIRFRYSGMPGYAWMVDDVCMLATNSPVTGLAENENELIKVFPNPTNGIFTVDIHKIQGEAEVRITDLQGRILCEQKASASMHTVDLEINSNAGVYLVTVFHENGQTTSTVIKK
ncbi:MAG: T9SS type A sorting domain-containing protein [Crocinitomicaceae bacterium]